MADQVMNIAKGRIVELYNRIENNDPANSALIIILLKANESDALLIDRDDLGALLGAAANTEADFTNYARIVLESAELAALPAPDDTNNRYDVDLPDQTWTAAGGASNNTLTKLLICYDSDTTGGADSAIIPLAHYDFVATTDGNDLIAQINAAGFFRAT